MAGSDLDGDLYFVTWREDLILTKDNYPAMHFPPGISIKKPGAICEEDLIHHIKNFIKTDKTGIIARQHLINADYRSTGIESKECIELAKIHSRAVDASKTGESLMLDPQLKVTQVPDFLEKSDHKISYLSTRIIGKLFRRTKSISDQLENVPRASGNETLESLQLDLEVSQLIKKLHSSYCSSIGKLKKEYGIQDECNLWIGKLPNSISEYKQKKLRQSLSDLQEELYSKILVDLKEKPSMKFSRCDIWNGCFHASSLGQRGICCSGLPWMLFDNLIQLKNQVNHDNELSQAKLIELDTEMYAALGNNIIQGLHNKKPTSSIAVRVLKQLFNSKNQEGKIEGSGFLDRFRAVVQKDLWIVFALEYILQKLEVQSSNNFEIDEEKIKTYIEILQCISNVLVSQSLAPYYWCDPQPETTYLQKLKLLISKNSDLDNTESAYKAFPKLKVNEYSKVGKLIVYTLWEVYAIASDLIPEAVKEKALSNLLELAYYDGNTSTQDASIEVEEARIIVDKSQLQMSHGCVDSSNQATQQTNLDYIKNQLLQEFSSLEYLHITQDENNRQIRCDCKGPKQVIERFKLHMRQYTIHNTSKVKRNFSASNRKCNKRARRARL